jgi:transmembrane sensor
MATSLENMIPWELIGSSLEGQITNEEETRLQEWISSGEENRELFDSLKLTWDKGFSDYNVYREANEIIAWNALILKLGKQTQVESETNVVSGDFTKKTFSIARLSAVAAILILALGSFLWYLYSNGNNVYQTGPGEQRTVSLPDGSSIKLSANTRIEVSTGYNKSKREVNLKNGEAYFDVKHNDRIAFIVNLGTASIEDVGTSFFIQKLKDSIKVQVTAGEVAFINNSDNDTRRLSAGMSLLVQTGKKSFNPVIKFDSVTTVPNLLQFDNTVLTEVIFNLGRAFNKKIVLTDSVLAQKRFTADLEGQAFEGAIEILSKSLSIKYFEKDDVYYLKAGQ